MTSAWRTEYAAEGAKMSKKQFEELVEVANDVTILAWKLTGGKGRRQR
ncbi:MAG: hypothetical protein QW057_09310 [Candidatus Bathyarchaeia archaeon]